MGIRIRIRIRPGREPRLQSWGGGEGGGVASLCSSTRTPGGLVQGISRTSESGLDRDAGDGFERGDEDEEEEDEEEEDEEEG